MRVCPVILALVCELNVEIVTGPYLENHKRLDWMITQLAGFEPSGPSTLAFRTQANFCWCYLISLNYDRTR